MCTGKCSRVVGLGLLPLALTCIVCNLLLCFPDWDTQYVHEGGKLLTPAVLYLGGLVGGGIMILIPAIHIQATGRQGCCGNRCGMFLSILFALVGLAGSVYAVSVSALGLVYGPLCQVLESNGSLGKWEQPFTQDELSTPSPEPKSRQRVLRTRVTTAHPHRNPHSARLDQDQEPRRPGPALPPRPADAEITDSVAPTVCPAGCTPPAPVCHQPPPINPRARGERGAGTCGLWSGQTSACLIVWDGQQGIRDWGWGAPQTHPRQDTACCSTPRKVCGAPSSRPTAPC
nr:uncharacterized protein LOC125629656 isoform X1 [Caretta caretta]